MLKLLISQAHLNHSHNNIKQQAQIMLNKLSLILNQMFNISRKCSSIADNKFSFDYNAKLEIQKWKSTSNQWNCKLIRIC